MKKYTPDDFQTFFAKTQAEARLRHINWDLLEQYLDTDLFDKTDLALQKIMADTGQAPDNWHQGHLDITLSDGQAVSASIANEFIQSHAHYTALRAMEFFEKTFSETLNNTTLSLTFIESASDFPSMLKMFPAEATHIYFQFRFPEVLQDNNLFMSVNEYIWENLSDQGIELGPKIPPINDLDAPQFVTHGWREIEETIRDVLIPESMIEQSEEPDENNGHGTNGSGGPGSGPQLN